ncbi:MAG: TraR/DksA family transcriptional regulator [Rhodobiaceae bacterium]|nr:TraR/DksA family transcriptional regulator [Rhodobiaceae bacterium]
MNDAKLKIALKAKRDELQTLLDQAAGDTAPVALDQTQQGRLSRMDAMQQQAMAAETVRRRQREISALTAALQRLQAGEYGYCLNCGEPIGEARLALDPAAAFCISHAR